MRRSTGQRTAGRSLRSPFLYHDELPSLFDKITIWMSTEKQCLSTRYITDDVDIMVFQDITSIIPLRKGQKVSASIPCYHS
jgi:hypothetical protein